MSNVYVVMYTQENGKQSLTYDQWIRCDHGLTPHRENGPALEFSNGDKVWIINNKRHRTDGPAEEFNGMKFWFTDNEPYSEEEFNQVLEEVRSMPLVLRLTDPRWWVREWKD